MEDEVKTGTEEVTEVEDDVLYDDDNDPEWDNVKWGKDDETESTEDASEEDIDGEDVEDADHSDETSAEDNGPTEGDVKPEAEDTDQYLELKHFNEIRKVGKEEAKSLAQKGLDYDNIRGERDTARSERDALKTENARLKEME